MQQSVIVYQMGKVGSTSIVEALTVLGLQAFHVHFLNPERLVRIATRHREQGIPLRGHYLHSFTVKEEFLDKGRPIKIITGTRDPVARNISGYFQNLKDFRPLKKEFEEDELQAMMNEFLEKYQHDFPLTWFDMEIKTALGVDVYKHPFPKNDGVQRIQENERDILVLKAEAATHLKVAALKEFLQISEFSLETKNVGTEKGYAHYYRPFLEHVQIPAAYLDKMYESRYVQHFYTSEEILEFRKRWTNNEINKEKEKISQSISPPTGSEKKVSYFSPLLLNSHIRTVESWLSSPFRRQTENLTFPRNLFWGKIKSRSIKQPVLVYQMGKVGSTSIVRMLTAAGLRAFHVHVLNSEKLIAIRKKHQEQGLRLPVHIQQAFQVKEKFLDKGRPVKIITAVRDPIARNISAYFQTLRLFRPLKGEFEDSELEAMMHEFINKYHHGHPFAWFNKEIKEVFDLDVYAHPFPKAEGVQRIQEGKADVLLLKVETADSVKVDAIKEFLQVPDLSLEAKNVGEEKIYAHYYRPFLERIQLPEAYIDKMYKARYTHHFYTSKEIHQFRRRWARGRTNDEREEP